MYTKTHWRGGIWLCGSKTSLPTKYGMLDADVVITGQSEFITRGNGMRT